MIFRKKYTMPIPSGAEIIDRDGKRVAQWRLRTGKRRSAEVIIGKDGNLRVRGQSRYYMARYRDGSGQIVEVGTECKDEVAARTVLAKLERNAELVRAGVMSAAEADSAGYAGLPFSKHVDAYEKHLQAKGGYPRRISMVLRRLERLARDCRFTRLNKMSAEPVERWLVEQFDAGMAAATRNTYRESLVCFGNWCRRTNRLARSPFSDLPRANPNVDPRHQRRALTEQQLGRLFRVARLRPLAEYGRNRVPTRHDEKQSKKSRATWKREPLTINNIDEAADRARKALTENPALVAELERIGHERWLIYRVLYLTGLRKGELSSLTVGQIDFSGSVAYAVLNAADEKNRQGSTIPIRADLAAELSLWLQERLDALQEDARKNGTPIPLHIPASTPLVSIPSGLIRILDRDLAVAGIPKRDERNRVFDVHGFRVTFGSHLCAAGIPLRTAQVAMRHSKPELTANVYSDPLLIDVEGAINALPTLELPQEDVPTNDTSTLPQIRRRATS